VELGGKETELPLLVPTLSQDEINFLLNTNVDAPDFLSKMPQTIKDKAIAFAKKRIAEGKSPFAGPGDYPKQ
jgi:hypothetical protein